MRRHRRSIQIVIFGLALALLPAGSPAAGNDGLSPETRQLLKQQKLRKLARNDASEAIRALDRLRSATELEALGTAIAEVALTAAHKATKADKAARTDTAAARKPASDELPGLYLAAAAAILPAALEQAAGSGGPALDLYREAVSGLVSALQSSPVEALSGGPRAIEGPLGRYELSWVDAGPEWTPATHEFRPVSGLRRERDVAVRQGLGAPLVAVGRAEREEDQPQPEGGVFEIYRYFYPLTAVLELAPADGAQPRAAVLRLIDPRLNESHEIAGTSYPLAIDIGAQFDTLEREAELISGKRGVLRAGNVLSLASLHVSEPLRPGKIPLVLTHGLASTPVTWATAGSELMLDPKIRRHYQVWLFTYPTGVDFPYSASLLRASLREAKRRLDAVGESPASDRMVMMGHSMGGLLTRMQVTDSGTTLWDTVFTEPPEQLELPAEDVEQMTRVFVFESLPFVERVVFCSTPHRGSKLASNFAGKIGAALVKLPKEAIELSRRILLHIGAALTDEAAQRKRIPDSVQSLQPKNAILEALDTLPIAPHVTYHSVIGDRGKGNSPDSSDGMVPYWSSHLEEAASELIVPSAHGSHKHPEGIAELRRILHLHLDAARDP
ncbi:MAG: hypothetical protein AAF560_15930 [Acidobacteriota bacterium]